MGEVTLGGDRLGSGNKQKVHMHGFERSTHNQGKLWKSTMAPGTLVPCYLNIALPGTTLDIFVDAVAKTLPTIGPLFGAFKLQVDFFKGDMRLYNRQLHNNKKGIGLRMQDVKFPTISMEAVELASADITDLDNAQINPSCVFSYLGIRGVGINLTGEIGLTRTFNAQPFLMYWDCVGNYYVNKNEEIGAVIHTTPPTVNSTVTEVTLAGSGLDGDEIIFPDQYSSLVISHTSPAPLPEHVLIQDADGDWWPANEVMSAWVNLPTSITGNYNWAKFGSKGWKNWRMITQWDVPDNEPEISTFPLANIDTMRDNILGASNSTPYSVNAANLTPYSLALGKTGTFQHKMYTMEGLALKTYQSDLFNNWVSQDWIEGAGGINEITAIDTSGGSFNIETLILGEKVYQMMLRVALSGGSYDDWREAIYDHYAAGKPETPVYIGGLSKEIVFQEVVSNSDAETSADGSRPLGTLAGKGVMTDKHKGGHIIVHADDPCYIMGIVSITPRLDYSQGNSWHIHLQTMNDLHKPNLDQIAFQDLITEQMAWWDTMRVEPGVWEQKSAGKTPAWINYMTDVNEVRGDFAIPTNSMFMTLNRRYEHDPENYSLGILDLTTYIDPKKFNHVFARKKRNAQNFWVQMAFDVTARRKMSAKVIPNL